MALSTVILWVHVLCGVAWVGASACVALAGGVLSGETDEWRRFASRSLPLINRLCVAVASLIPITGIANLTFVAQARHGVLPAAFVAVLSAKIALYAGMGTALWAAWRIGTPAGGRNAPAEVDPGSVRRLTGLYAIIVVLGAIALGLALWLSGT
jgi:hypothetical protein